LKNLEHDGWFHIQYSDIFILIELRGNKRIIEIRNNFLKYDCRKINRKIKELSHG
jgi:hypothetical protein